ncbi:DUF2254 domain-containing protein [Hymenobacter sp. B1770]|uniref:DUF2254 domain-containing protein n=1 Tax=Hymenobacter sp. B1770 TaxID=1718788 RepID=UPI003CF0BE09
MNRFKRLWLNLNASLWFLPVLMVLVFLGLAYGLVHIDPSVTKEWERDYPLLFGAGAEAARSMLAALATSMITVAALIFTLTLTTLAQVSSQYSPRVIWTYMRDRGNQVVLGSFVGIFAYCLVVLRTIRGTGKEEFLPSLAIAFALVLALLSIGVLIYFIHHIASSIDASNIVQHIMHDTKEAMGQLFPTETGQAADDSEVQQLDERADERTWHTVPALVSGYLQSVDDQLLLRVAREWHCVVRMELAPGSYVAEGSPLVSVAPEDREAALPAKVDQQLHRAYVIGSQRTIEQDAGFGLRQIVDIALKALSPGVNDTSTAIVCIDHLGDLLAYLGCRDLGTRLRSEEPENRVLLLSDRPSYASYVSTAFDQIRISGSANVAVLLRLLSTLHMVARRTPSPARRRVLHQQSELIADTAERKLDTEYERNQVREQLAKLWPLLEQPQAAS